MRAKSGVATVDEYLSSLDGDQRAALEKLRRVIRSVAPKAEECVSYQIAAFRQNGMLVGFGASATHCAFYPMNGSTVAAFKRELKGYETSKGTIRFQPEHPLPAALVRKIVKARLAENLADRPSRGRKTARRTGPPTRVIRRRRRGTAT